jgi:predicted nucleotidyltransferase
MLPFDDPNPRGELILGGINGSTAYGLDTPESDIDRIGCYVAPTSQLHGLHPPTVKTSTWHGTAPDFTYHEAGKLAGLLLHCNPTVTELLWLDKYELWQDAGQMLIDIRRMFLSEKYVRDAYFGYASQQFRRIKNRGDGTFSSDTAKRTEKHARHLWRLLNQGVELHRTGKLTVRLTPVNAEKCREFGQRVAAGNLMIAEEVMTKAEAEFDTPGMLPDAASDGVVEQWLRFVRREYWDGF